MPSTTPPSIFPRHQDEDNVGNVKRQLAKLFEISLKATVPDESNMEPLIAACTGKFGDYQCNNAMGRWSKLKGKKTEFKGPPSIGQFGMLIEFLFENFQTQKMSMKQPLEIFRHSTGLQNRDLTVILNLSRGHNRQWSIFSVGKPSIIRHGHKFVKLAGLNSTRSINVLEFIWRKRERPFIIHIFLGF